MLCVLESNPVLKYLTEREITLCLQITSGPEVIALFCWSFLKADLEGTSPPLGELSDLSGYLSPAALPCPSPDSWILGSPAPKNKPWNHDKHTRLLCEALIRKGLTSVLEG